ncbi:hypothetical protein [Mycolicibacterium arseniciresistens]|uniref:Uncharacterized protein n=1 Tax=Mycolicibacterium arseniciresistens TaxID=3062257 RepID=A0ABT8UGR2_9MYCO|nr:hypothetical protein [Mycolicibacterium arseniciresistens]MDO3636961.1 hypothetical protein [Mycolicibacterium arseniciresistens]
MDDFEATMARARAHAAMLDGAVEALCGAARTEDVTRLLDALRADLDRLPGTSLTTRQGTSLGCAAWLLTSCRFGSG